VFVKCFECGNEEKLSLDKWRCDCGGAWEPLEHPIFVARKIDKNDYTIWRYGDLLGLDIVKPIKAMGVGWTPLVPFEMHGHSVNLKLEYLSPSGSFKDRGVNAMVNQLVSMGAKKLVEDSSGNAGASLAAHAARFGLDAKIYVPEATSPMKIHQISVYGATVRPIQGSRSDVEKAAQTAIGNNMAYASHAYNPAYLVGQETAAFELWEQLGFKAPTWIFCPVAQGGLFLGLWFGFQNLLAAELIDHLPRLIAVQSERVAPIYQAWKNDLDNVPAVLPTETTVAEGIAVTKPARGKRIIKALKASGGDVMIVKEPEIFEAHRSMLKSGFYIEPTSAVAVSGFRHLSHQIKDGDQVVIFLTGNGLKAQQC
jgi:threonine synthase